MFDRPEQCGQNSMNHFERLRLDSQTDHAGIAAHRELPDVSEMVVERHDDAVVRSGPLRDLAIGGQLHPQFAGTDGIES